MQLRGELKLVILLLGEETKVEMFVSILRAITIKGFVCDLLTGGCFVEGMERM